jgi:4-diphosphocytidyl-2-C-methyl-D-erythritol kinase
MPTLRIRAHAKVNLFLEVLGRRPDGFHRLETIFQTIALHDVITLRRHPAGYGISLTCDEPGIPTDATNLVWRAVEAFISGHEGQAGHLELHLQKGIPHGAGLGGGSSDAAAVLRLLAGLFPGWHDASSLHRLAGQLGSDVPFFLIGGTAHGEERGEVLTPLADLPSTILTVLMPPERLPTPAVFKALTEDERGPRPGRGAAWWRANLGSGRWTALMENRLTAAAVRLCPVVGETLERLHALGLPCLMSGSGAACFALAAVPAAATPVGGSAWETAFVPRADALAPADVISP